MSPNRSGITDITLVPDKVDRKILVGQRTRRYQGLGYPVRPRFIGTQSSPGACGASSRRSPEVLDALSLSRSGTTSRRTAAPFHRKSSTDSVLIGWYVTRGLLSKSVTVMGNSCAAPWVRQDAAGPGQATPSHSTDFRELDALPRRLAR